MTGMTIQEEFEELLALCEQCRDAAAACGDMKSSKAIDEQVEQIKKRLRCYK